MALLFSWIIFLTGVSLSQPICPLSWAQFEDTCYYFSHTTANWLDAEKYCRHENAVLAAIDTSAKSAFIDPILGILYDHGKTGYWLGATDMFIEGQWRWVKNGQLLSYTNWGYTTKYGQEPNSAHGEENCMYIGLHGGTFNWADTSCNDMVYFICEKESNSSTQAPQVIG